MHIIQPPETVLKCSSQIEGLTDASNVIKPFAWSITYPAAAQVISANGDIFIFNLFLTGNETKILIGSIKGSDKGIFDLWINDSLNSSAYDDYAPFPTAITREITVSVSFRKGKNVIKIKVNGKNAASSAYYLYLNGVTAQ